MRGGESRGSVEGLYRGSIGDILADGKEHGNYYTLFKKGRGWAVAHHPDDLEPPLDVLRGPQDPSAGFNSQRPGLPKSAFCFNMSTENNRTLVMTLPLLPCKRNKKCWASYTVIS